MKAPKTGLDAAVTQSNPNRT